MSAVTKDPIIKRRSAISYFKQNYEWYLFLIPGFAFLFLFELMPMSYISIAFKSFKGAMNINSSPWVGLDQFVRMFSDSNFYLVVKNTIVINLYKLIFILPLPLILSLLLNEVRIMKIKKAVQTIIYIPHFFTWVVVFSVFYIVFGSGGLVNTIIGLFGGDPILFFMKGGWFRFLLVLSDAWHSVGWGTIIYLAAIAGINSEIYEAAIVDGANKFKQMLHVTLPCLLPTFVLLVSINLGHIMSSGFGQVLVFYNPTVYNVGDIISTYVYRTGLGQANYSYATAVGLFNSAIGFVLVILSNYLSKAVTGKSVW